MSKVINSLDRKITFNVFKEYNEKLKFFEIAREKLKYMIQRKININKFTVHRKFNKWQGGGKPIKVNILTQLNVLVKVRYLLIY
jgi:hypothetical protein